MYFCSRNNIKFLCNMATINSIVFKTRFRVDSLTVYNRAGLMVVRSRHNSSKGGACTVAQMRMRSWFTNQMNLWHCFPQAFRPVFEERRAGVSPINLFIAHGKCSDPVFLARHEAQNGACVLTPVVVADGTLPPIALSHDGVAPVTDLAVGALAVDADTTVAALSAAIVRGNGGFCFGDELLYYLGLQQWDAVHNMPVVEMRCSRLVLCRADNRTVVEATGGGAGFAVRGGRVAAAAEVQGGMAWVHVRRRPAGLLCSSQRLLCNNPLIARYSGSEAMEAAGRSYGVVTEAQFLVPDGGACGCQSL